MNEDEKQMHVQPVSFSQIADALRRTRTFAEADFESLAGIEVVESITVPADTVIAESGGPLHTYWIVVDGEIKAERIEPDGTRTQTGMAKTGDGFGEAAMLTGKRYSPFLLTTVHDSRLIRFSEQQFWDLLAASPQARKVILADMSQRLHTHQVEALHREKLVSLGTLAAGLMHELHNPGAAAKRAASQLRENLMRLQQVSMRHSDRAKTPDQMECIRGLLQHALKGCRITAMSTLDQADAEEAMGEWLASSGVENAYSIAPTLVGMGFDREELACARDYFDPSEFSDVLNWLEALVSSAAHVCAIEESISRISDLVMAVKKFAYDDKSQQRALDVHDSLQSTLTILGHKLRIKQVEIEKRFDASPSTIETRGSALSQVWTNLIDNAVDASPAQSKIEIATWSEPEWLAVCIRDHGSGIPQEVLPRIFEPFFTTKPQGAGTGLGLEIVHRIVTQKFGGTIEVQSKPGETQFIVRLPRKPGSSSVPSQPAETKASV